MKNENLAIKIITSCFLALFVLALSMGIGSVSVSLSDSLSIIWHKLSGTTLPETIDASIVSILWEIRMPRVFAAFFVGAAISVSGAVMQAVLQNPLASSYTMGVSAGASLGAAVIIVTGATSSLLGYFLLPITGFATGLLTVLLVIAVSAGIDRNMHNHTIVLFGMVFSLFVNAILTFISSMAGEHTQRLILWQMGSFSGKRWMHAGILCVGAIIGTLLVYAYHKELDIISFGDEQAQSIGVDTGRTKIILLVLASFLTGVAVCFSGIIGFVDLTIPHVVRRIFGSKHRLVIPMSMLMGGAFMALADMVSRTLLAPREIPVGAVTALVGAPFFAWVYFHDGRK